VAVGSTIPWDSYLLHAKVWSYPSSAVAGPTLFLIPYEELFFFVVQTYITSLLYLLLSKPVLRAAVLPSFAVRSNTEYKDGRAQEIWRLRKIGLRGGTLLVAIIGVGAQLVYSGGNGTYLGLIFVWAGPILLFLW